MVVQRIFGSYGVSNPWGNRSRNAEIRRVTASRRIKGERAGLCQKKNIEELLAICAKLDDRAAVR